MIEFQKLKVRNFLSYGNNWTEFNFNKGICRITGINGSGKSTIPTDALNYALFGRPYRKIKIDQLVNSINKKNMEVVLEFKRGEDQYRVERGQKPNYIRIFRNDDLIPHSSTSRGYQQVLEEDILNFNENIANQVMIKSLTKNASFMNLAKGEKRNIIENLLDIALFSLINKNIKNKVDTLEFSVQAIKKDIDNIELLIEQELINLEQLKNIQKRFDKESKQKIKEINTEIAKLKADNEKYEEGIVRIKRCKKTKEQRLKEVENEKSIIKKLRDKQSSIKANIQLLEDKIQMFKDTCSDCPKIGKLLNVDSLDDYKKELQDIEQNISDRRTVINDLEVKIRKLDEILANEKYVLGNIERNNKKIEELNKNITKELSQEIIIDETKLLQHKENKKECEIKYNDVSKHKKHYQVLRSLFSDDGIKAFIIKKYLPYINKLLNTYLRKFNTDIIFNFDQEFNEVVLSRYKEDFTYHSFSEGQKKRIDLAVLFSFINFAMYKNKKSNTNILILDEILSGLDHEGKNRLYDLLKEYRDHQNKSIITISHDTDLDPDSFNEVYRIFLDKGFSKLEKVDI